MTIADRIYDEAKRLPENLANEVLDFILFLEQQHVIRPPMNKRWDALSLDTREWRFDREEANER